MYVVYASQKVLLLYYADIVVWKLQAPYSVSVDW